jgi:phosphoribosylaminoimidazolecarboxamide formyltransferase / IMP cyclohydrolase
MKKALISVSDKTGIVEFARNIHSLGYEIISTGGTFKAIQEGEVPVVKIDDVTGFPEILDGRVKTLHPKIHGGLLAVRDSKDHMAQVANHSIELIDMVVVNLYPFKETVASGASLEECIEQIDIGGPSMLRSAAKNHSSVTVVTDPDDYDRVLKEIRDNGDTSTATRSYLALKVYASTAAYDAAIAAYLESQSQSEQGLPENLALSATKIQGLRYGENPHQAASLYGSFYDTFEQIHGKELSYNNIVDIQAAAELVEEFSEPATAIIKHTNPCGCAIGDSVSDAYSKALTSDPVSAFGGIVCVNRAVTTELALKLNDIFTEVIIAPSYDADALELLRKKANRRLMIQKGSCVTSKRFEIKSVANGYLCQTLDAVKENPADWVVATERKPSAEEFGALAFAWRVAKHVKSNAIVYTNSEQILAVGAGQMSRVDSAEIASMKAANASMDLRGSAVASDAFFPFADGLLQAVKAGAKAVVQPGGSVRDQEVIDAANENDIAMVFTGHRHFKH